MLATYVMLNLRQHVETLSNQVPVCLAYTHPRIPMQYNLLAACLTDFTEISPPSGWRN